MTAAAKQDARNDIPAPWETLELQAQGRAERTLLSAWQSGRLPHAWLLTGPRGVGKATLAYRFARFVLSGGGEESGGLFGDAAPATSLEVDPEAPVARRLAHQAHPDLTSLRRTPDPQGKSQKLRSVITVDQVRKAVGFLQMTPGEGGWRILIVDAAEDMNANAQNALLKALEEPKSNTLILLISHAPGQLLPTIHSRCCRLPLAPLPEDVVEGLLAKFRPDIGTDDGRALARLSEGSIGRALDMADIGGLELYRDVVDILTGLPELDIARVDALADRLGRDSDGQAFRVGGELICWWLARMIRSGAGGAAPTEVVAGENALADRLLAARGLDRWLSLWEKINRLFDRAERANLNRKQVIVTAFLELRSQSAG
ncbi:MAG: DNA polymerase III subunit delta' [Rhodovibrionaceae bacterium]|nr:DNA polymerase III subunit delta' [Rhodovibrionaceae bacterium]